MTYTHVIHQGGTGVRLTMPIFNLGCSISNIYK